MVFSFAFYRVFAICSTCSLVHYGHTECPRYRLAGVHKRIQSRFRLAHDYPPHSVRPKHVEVLSPWYVETGLRNVGRPQWPLPAEVPKRTNEHASGQNYKEFSSSWPSIESVSFSSGPYAWTKDMRLAWDQVFSAGT